MRKKCIGIMLLVSLLCVGMTGCTSDSVDNTEKDTQVSEEITQEEKDNFVSDFLLEFFNFNCNGRYDTLMETVENDDSLVDVNDTTEGIQPLPENQQKALESYYADLSKYVTEECMVTMQANRIPVQLDRFVNEKGIKASVDYVELISDDEDTYSYKVYFEEEGEVYFIDPLAGQVSIEIVDGEIKITAISIVQ